MYCGGSPFNLKVSLFVCFVCFISVLFLPGIFCDLSLDARVPLEHRLRVLEPPEADAHP